MDESEFDLALDELGSAEDFLDYFGIAYEPAVVHVNRLHMLQRFHDYLDMEVLPDDEQERREIYAGLLNRAYSDFVNSDARTEKVFKVFQMQEPVSVEVPLPELSRRVPPNAS